MTTATMLQLIAAAIGLFSAYSWYRGATVKVSREEALRKRVRAAEKKGETPYLGGATFDGWEVGETLSAQSKRNAIGAAFAAVSVLLQSIATILSVN